MTLQPPTINIVAVLMPNECNSAQRHTILCALQAPGDRDHLQSFTDSHWGYNPLSYPLLFPDSTDCFHLGILHRHGSQHVTAMQFYAYMLMQRDPSSSILHSRNRLFQQYIADMWDKVETGRLNFFRIHQKKLCDDFNKGRQDAVHAVNADSAGRHVILPATFTEGPRFMAKHYQDVMAIVRKFGKPTFFITFTCNAQWSEIVIELQQNQTKPKDRPDLTA